MCCEEPRQSELKFCSRDGSRFLIHYSTTARSESRSLGWLKRAFLFQVFSLSSVGGGGVDMLGVSHPCSTTCVLSPDRKGARGGGGGLTGVYTILNHLPQIWVWVNIKPPGDRMFPHTRASIFDPQPYGYVFFKGIPGSSCRTRCLQWRTSLRGTSALGVRKTWGYAMSEKGFWRIRDSLPILKKHRPCMCLCVCVLWVCYDPLTTPQRFSIAAPYVLNLWCCLRGSLNRIAGITITSGTRRSWYLTRRTGGFAVPSPGKHSWSPE